MVILGIDPGTLITGYGIIESKHGTVRALAFDAIKNKSDLSMPLRLKRIYEALQEAIDAFHPDVCAIETAFYGKNAQSALKLGHARGVAMLAAVIRQLPTSEYSPREVKKAITGKGTASKQQVQYMVRSLLTLSKVHKYFDTTDALAVAICHLHRTQTPTRPFTSWKAFVTAHPSKVVNPQNREIR
jgi:crossover junction endodeoxyribonuclease RuvC